MGVSGYERRSADLVNPFVVAKEKHDIRFPLFRFPGNASKCTWPLPVF